MQWLIDLIKDWVNAQGFLSTAYVDRGDPADNDFEIGDLTADNNWHDLNLSGIVPAEAKAIHLTCVIESTLKEKFARFRKKGNINAANVLINRAQIAGVRHHTDGFVACDSNRTIQYFIQSPEINDINLSVRGWLF